MMIAFSPGTVTALVGGDGAGKTSLLKTLTSAQGRAQMGVGALSTGEGVGYQGATSGTWPQLTVVENLQFAARAHSMPRNVTQARIDALCEAARLDEARDRLASRLSGGMRQKLGVLMAMIHSPALLLLMSQRLALMLRVVRFSGSSSGERLGREQQWWWRPPIWTRPSRPIRCACLIAGSSWRGAVAKRSWPPPQAGCGRLAIPCHVMRGPILTQRLPFPMTMVRGPRRTWRPTIQLLRRSPAVSPSSSMTLIPGRGASASTTGNPLTFPRPFGGRPIVPCDP